MEIVYQLYKESEGDHSGFFDTFILPVLRELPENTKKTSSKYLSVGLNNLGSTCYMNAMLQVLNSIEPLRNAIMMANVESPLIR
jgi:ubiquitin C-terminal hydrolase